jgi:hypothetical protein
MRWSDQAATTWVRLVEEYPGAFDQETGFSGESALEFAREQVPLIERKGGRALIWVKKAGFWKLEYETPGR